MCSAAWSADVWDNYIDLANTYLFVEAHIMNDGDTALDGGADVGPVNLWPHWRQIRKVLDPLEPMSILSAPNTHNPHWSV
jgi:hypothetical protein